MSVEDWVAMARSGPADVRSGTRVAMMMLCLCLSVACKKTPPHAATAPDRALPYDVRLADTMDALEGYRGSVLGLAQFRASDRRLRALGEKMTEASLSRSSRLYLWRKKHFPNVPESEPLEVPCKRDVLEGAMLPMNPTDKQIVDTILLQTRCEVLFVGTVIQKTNDVELLNAGHEIIKSSGENVSALLLLKKEMGQ